MKELNVIIICIVGTLMFTECSTESYDFEPSSVKTMAKRKALMADIMGEDGLKWKDNSFPGLSDYLSKENEKDHFYKTEEEKQEEESKQKAAEDVPKFTDKSEPKQEPPKEDKKPVPRIW